MDEGRAVQQFDRGRRGFGSLRVVVAAGGGHREAEPGPNAVAPREHRVADRLGEPRRGAGRFRVGDRDVQGPFDALACVHRDLPCQFALTFLSVSYD